jgi:hypothetical protein
MDRRNFLLAALALSAAAACSESAAADTITVYQSPS